jgi:hypothetical protein
MEEFRDAIAKITIDGLEGRGTGFLVAPDLVATALHVVADRKTEPPTFATGTIWLEFRGHKTEAILTDKFKQDADCILLKCRTPPPPEYPIIPLRELREHGGLFRTRGYPNAQPVNGMVWDGDVSSYDEELTNYYQTRDAVYRPVLQLFCKQAGAGTGAPPAGMSGAPVVVGAAAVGLMRFALMKDGCTVAGTLYACSATDIVTLDPAALSLRPPLAAVVILLPEQIPTFEAILVRLFTDKIGNLRRVVRFTLGNDAERSISSQKDLNEVVSTLRAFLVQQGPGMISALLRGVVTACPADGELHAFVRSFSSYSLEPLDDDAEHQKEHDKALIDDTAEAMVALAGLPRGAALQKIMASYRPDFEKTQIQIDILARYKELHSILHAIQKQLEEFSRTVDRLRSENEEETQAAQAYLKDYARTFNNLWRKAESKIEGLPTGEDETAWVDRLGGCAEDVQAASEPTASVAATEKVLEAPQELTRILAQPNATRINRELVNAAKHVRLDNFAETMRSVEEGLGPSIDSKTMQRLQAGSLAVGRLRSRLAGLIAEHDEWQGLNSDVEYAKGQPQHRPRSKFQDWQLFTTKIIGLCDTFPREAWSMDIRTIMQPWLEDESPEEPKLKRNIKKLDADFLSFYKLAVQRFMNVDDELDALCEKITAFGPLLNGFV